MNKVKAITEFKKVKELKRKVKENEGPRNYLLFAMALSTGIRPNDILELKIRDIRKSSGEIRDFLYKRENKTNKEQHLELSDTCKEALRYYFDNIDIEKFQQQNFNLAQDDWLFPKKRGDGHIGRVWAWSLSKEWFKSVGLDQQYSLYSLRKTHGWILRKVLDTPLEVIQEKFNHSKPKTTRRYIGLLQQEVNEAESQVNF